MEELYEAKCREGEVRELFLYGLSWLLPSFHIMDHALFSHIVTFSRSCLKVSLQIEEVGSPSKESPTKYHYSSPYVSKYLCAYVYNHRRKPTLILLGFKIPSLGIS